MEIREVRPEEYDEAGRVCAGAYLEFVPPDRSRGWRDYLGSLADVRGRADRTVVLVAVEDGRVLGTATIELDEPLGDDDDELPPGTSCLRMVGVSPEARGRGIGKALVQETIDRVRAAGKDTLILRTTVPMKVAQRMYESMGFERDTSLDGIYPDVHLLGYRMRLT